MAHRFALAAPHLPDLAPFSPPRRSLQFFKLEFSVLLFFLKVMLAYSLLLHLFQLLDLELSVGVLSGTGLQMPLSFTSPRCSLACAKLVTLPLLPEGDSLPSAWFFLRWFIIAAAAAKSLTAFRRRCKKRSESHRIRF